MAEVKEKRFLPATPDQANGLVGQPGCQFLALGALLGAAWLVGGIDSSLFPTGWIFPAVLLASGALMTARRRFDLVITLWAGLTLATFILAVLLYTDAQEILDDSRYKPRRQ